MKVRPHETVEKQGREKQHRNILQYPPILYLNDIFRDRKVYTPMLRREIFVTNYPYATQ